MKVRSSTTNEIISESTVKCVKLTVEPVESNYTFEITVNDTDNDSGMWMNYPVNNNATEIDYSPKTSLRDEVIPLNPVVSIISEETIDTDSTTDAPIDYKALYEQALITIEEQQNIIDDVFIEVSVEVDTLSDTLSDIDTLDTPIDTPIINVDTPVDTPIDTLDTPRGVTYMKGRVKPYRVRCKVGKVSTLVGYYATVQEASDAYEEYKQSLK